MAEPRRSLAVPIKAENAPFLVLEAVFYEPIGEMLRAGALRVLRDAGANVEVQSVPGALELPIALAIAAERNPPAGVVALGCVVRGDTYHFEIVCNESARGLLAVASRHALPLGNGVLTVNSMEQAEIRADPARGDKGGDAARAALALWQIKNGSTR